MKKILFIIILNIFLFALCKEERNPIKIIQNTIHSIDTVQTISYDQHLIRTNPQNTNETIERDRSFIYKKLAKDSITGAKAHILYYSQGLIVFEDIYDGNFLLRKNYFDSTAAYYDLIKYPEFKKSNLFWRKNTPYTIQALLDFTINNKKDYKIELINDTIIGNTECFSIRTTLKNKNTMPGFNNDFNEDIGIVEVSYYYINKCNYYPLKLRFERFKIDAPEQVFFTDHQFYNIIFNLNIDDNEFSYPKDLKDFKIDHIDYL